MRIRCFFICFAFFVLSWKPLFAQLEPVDLIATDTFGILGQEVTIDIKVNGFTDIISCQASINFDPAILSFVEVSNFGIKDLDISDFGTASSDQGHVRFAWTPDDAIAVSTDDGTVLFSVTFEVLSDNQATATIDFEDKVSTDPFPIEFANDNYDILDVNTTNGTISIFSTASEAVNIASSPNTSCNEKSPNGSLEADVNGNTESYTFNWYTGTEIKATPDFTGPLFDQLVVGDYSLQVLDANDEVFVEKKSVSVLSEPVGTPDVITEITNVPQKSCSDDPVNFTGLLEIEVNNEQPDGTYNISWWKGNSETGEELTAFTDQYKADLLDVGDYEVVVENPVSTCKAYLSSSITEDLVSFNISLTATDNENCGENGSGSATVQVSDPAGLNLRYFWFMENDAIDTTKSLSNQSTFENIVGGNYKSYVLDLNYLCDAQAIISVGDNPQYPTPEITQSNDTLYANFDNANWLMDDAPLNIEAPYLVPEQAAWYSIKVTNEYQCTDTSALYNYNITGLKENLVEISIYPNPFTQYVHISNPDENIDNIFVYDTKGLLLQEIYDVKQKFIDLHINGSSDGIYLIKIQSGEKILERKVFKNFTK